MRHAYFLGANAPYKALKITLKAESMKTPGRPRTATLHALSQGRNLGESPSRSSIIWGMR